MTLPRDRLYLLADMLHIPYRHSIGQYNKAVNYVYYWKIVQESGTSIARRIINKEPVAFYNTSRTTASQKQINFGLNLMWERAIFLTSIDQLIYQDKVGTLLNWLQQKPNVHNDYGWEIPDHHDWKRTTPNYPQNIA